MRITDDYVFFYKDWLSNYQKTNFVFPSVYCPIFTFRTTEQAFMYFKALCFKDYKTAKEIYDNGENPDKCRQLGRKVMFYNDEVWSQIRYQLFYDLNFQKYSQDKKLKEKLLDKKFDGKIFVEASPIDRIWGVGLDENNPLIDDESNWRGKNYLGKIITEIRIKLKTYIHKKTGNPYSLVTDNFMFKQNGEWIRGLILYQTEYKNPDGKFFAREPEDFYKNFKEV